MATATLLHPSTTYPPPSYSSGYPQPSSSGMIASADSRRSAEDSDHSKRQSLPSISEVISGAKSNQYPSSASSSIQPNTGFPSPFSGPPRSYGEAEKHPSPQSHRPASTYPPGREPLSSFADSPRTSFNSRPGLPPVSDRRPSPSIKPELPPHHYPHDSQKDHRTLNGGYPHPPAPPASSSASSYSSGPLPHGQMPLPTYPASPRHAPPHSYGSYDQRGQPAHMEDGDRGMRPPFETPALYTAPWNYGESLGRLAQSSRTLFTFAEAYGRLAQEQHGAHTIPERLPTEQEVNDMLSNADMVRASLERVKEAVHQSIRNERAREAPKAATYEEERDVPMFEDGMKSQYAITEVKKRRGRAAPPGRCHSCNRVDTPEWRRGPDGARTLCNACGLHYAKLERKRQLEQRNIRPKPEDRN
ncbi:hypothetical protein ACO1O0_002195 [Amphichorda felina]